MTKLKYPSFAQYTMESVNTMYLIMLYTSIVLFGSNSGGPGNCEAQKVKFNSGPLLISLNKAVRGP